MIETHILDFNETIYGEDIEVNFYHFIRSEQKFESIDALQCQIAKDKQQILQFFKDDIISIAK